MPNPPPSSLQLPAPTNMPLGQPLGPYILTERLGIGGLAEVYRAERPLLDHRLSHAVAIKRLHKHLTTDPKATQHLLDEARIALRLQHPNIAQTYEIDHADGTFFLVMELIQGLPLSQLLSSPPSPLPLPAALFIIREAASALAYAHSLTDDNGHPLNLIHLDISPDNLLLSHHGHIKLIDFGLAIAREQLSSPNSARMRGRAKYLSPERAQGLKVQPPIRPLLPRPHPPRTPLHPPPPLPPRPPPSRRHPPTLDPPDLSPYASSWPPISPPSSPNSSPLAPPNAPPTPKPFIMN